MRLIELFDGQVPIIVESVVAGDAVAEEIERARTALVPLPRGKTTASQGAEIPSQSD
ncbi:MAG: hypothetical protein V2A73_23070 [Pseudomonadota bacterium]